MDYRFGTVLHISLPRNQDPARTPKASNWLRVPAVTGQLQGFCFVEYKLASEAVAAVGGLTGACIDGHTVQPMAK